jgi:hypothetical protein
MSTWYVMYDAMGWVVKATADVHFERKRKERKGEMKPVRRLRCLSRGFCVQGLADQQRISDTATDETNQERKR